MEPTSVLSDYYRLRLSDALRGRLELSANQIRNEAAKPVVIADVLTLRQVINQPVPPIDPGELKHSALDRKSPGDTTENSIPLNQPAQPHASTAMEYARRYLAESRIDHSDFRRRMEDRVRRSKRAGRRGGPNLPNK